VAAYYADSSVLVKRHLAEVGTAWFQTLADPQTGNVVVTAQISEVEGISAIQRRVREGFLSGSAAQQLGADFRALCQSEYRLVMVTPTVVARACDLLTQHPLRAYDAVQLASALSANDALQAAGLNRATFLSADQRLLQAAAAEGLSTDDPNLHP
jgi:uncharacterized protein